jgi:hypothetical protein
MKRAGEIPRDCKPWRVLRGSVHSRNVPGRRSLAVSSALQSARSSTVKTELKKNVTTEAKS